MSQDRLSTRSRAVFLILILATLASGFYFAGRSGSNPNVYNNDFNVYYHASREVASGRDPYQHSLGDWTPYIYPPLLAELIVPLAILPLPVGAYFWFLVSAASVFGAAWLSASLARGQQERGAMDKRVAVGACAVVVVLRFVLDTFDLGQVNAIVAALAVANVYLYSRDRKALSAIALVLAISIKLTPALLLVYYLAKSRFKFVLACTALLVAVTAVSLLPFGSRGPQVFQKFWDRTVRNEQGYDFAYSGNQSLRGALARLKAEQDESRRSTDPTTLLISIGLLSVAAFAAARSRFELAGAAPFFCCIVLLSPLSWKAHYMILILPAVFLVSIATGSTRARLVMASLLGVTFVLFNLTSPRVIGLEAAEWADFHSLVVAGALLMFIGSTIADRRLPIERNQGE